MRTVKNVAVVEASLCTGCDICVRICPVQAIALGDAGHKRALAVVDGRRCLDCSLCAVRCPTYAITMAALDVPFEVGVAAEDAGREAAANICHAAHMYPEQVVCYCHRVQAKEIATAILRGARTPEDVALATGARTGCGTLCITGVIRVLRAAGVALDRAPGYQWYGVQASIWTVPPEVEAKYPLYRVGDDRRAIDELFPAKDELSPVGEDRQ